MKLSYKNALTGYSLVLPLIAGCVLFYGLAFGIILWNALTKGTGYSMTFAGLGNFTHLLGNSVFQKALWNTMRFLLVGIPLVLAISYAVALLLKRQTGVCRFLESVVLLPYVMPVVGTVLLIQVLFAESGLLNEILQRCHLPVQDWLQSEYAFWVLIGLYLWKNTGYGVVLLLSGLNTISQEQYAVAALDGANPWQQFWRITMPQMWYSVFFAGVFSLINAFKCFREILLIGGNYPHESIYMMQHFINNCFEKLSYSKMAVASMLLTLTVGIVFAVCYRWVLRKEAYKE